MKVAQAYYSTAVEHREMPGCYLATFAIPGDAPQWVNDTDGRPKIFKRADEAELAGFKVMVSKLNRARDVQSFRTKDGFKRKGGIKVFRSADTEDHKHTVESVFGRKS